MLKELIENWSKYCIEENFIGIGSTRKVYKVDEYVIKVHLHSIGYQQSKNEFNIYQFMKEKEMHSLFAEPYYVDERISIQEFVPPLEMIHHQSYEIDRNEHGKFLSDLHTVALEILDKEMDGFDLKDSSNFGLNHLEKLVFIDYGMTKKLYEKEWVPLAVSGVLPQIDYDQCCQCGIKKELRMYGEDDTDKRCYACGKE